MNRANRFWNHYVFNGNKRRFGPFVCSLSKFKVIVFVKAGHAQLQYSVGNADSFLCSVNVEERDSVLDVHHKAVDYFVV